MKPVPFDYVRPQSIEEACALLAAGEDVRLIAGGQTLVPMLAMRLARPAQLVDICRLPGLAGIRDDGDAIAIGATTRQVQAEHDARIAAKLPLLAKALPWIGHQATRNRGTVGGSMAHGDPAAEIPLVAVTLGAEIVVHTREGVETLSAVDFFLGPTLTALPFGGLISEIRFPIWPQKRIGAGFHEISARRSDFALAAAAAQVAFGDDGRCIACAIGLGGVADRPLRLETASAALVGTTLSAAEVAAALGNEIGAVEAVDDLHASSAYRRRAALTLAARALQDAVTEARA